MLDAFTEGVTERSGLINVKKLAAAIHLPMTVIAPSLGFSSRFLNANPTSEKVQAKATLLLGTLNDIAGHFGGDKAMTIRYLNTSQPDFRGKTPIDQLKNGHLEYFAGYVGEIVTMRPD